MLPRALQVKGQENACAIGDATDIPVSKTGVTAHLEATVAAGNIIFSIKGEGEVHKYTGRINCPLGMGSGTASFVIGTNDKPVKEVQPTVIRYAMKRVFAYLYWRRLSGNWDWLLNTHFGNPDIVEAVTLLAC